MSIAPEKQDFWSCWIVRVLRTEIHLELLAAEIESELDILMASGLLAATFENCSKQKSSGKKNMHLISFDYLRGVQYCF